MHFNTYSHQAQIPALSPMAPPGRAGRIPHLVSLFKVWGSKECSGRSRAGPSSTPQKRVTVGQSPPPWASVTSSAKWESYSPSLSCGPLRGLTR